MAKKILLADDSITIQKVISITFASEDYELIIAGDGDSAIKKAKEAKPDLILADVAMPEKTGYEVCEAIKGDPSISNTPVMLLAGTFEPLNKEEAARVRADESIVKPFESQELLDKVKGLLERGAKPGSAPEESVAEDLVSGQSILEEAKPQVSEDIWESGDFLGFNEDFGKGEDNETAQAPDLDFLDESLFEPNAASSGKGGFVDLELGEEDLKPAQPAQTKATDLPISTLPELETFDRGLGKEEPLKESAFESGTHFDLETFMAEPEKKPAPPKEEPVFEAPRYEEPRPDEFTFEEPKFEGSSFELPKFEEPVLEAPVFEAQPLKEPEITVPIFEEPKIEAIVKEEPRAEEPDFLKEDIFAKGFDLGEDSFESIDVGTPEPARAEPQGFGFEDDILLEPGETRPEIPPIEELTKEEKKEVFDFGDTFELEPVKAEPEKPVEVAMEPSTIEPIVEAQPAREEPFDLGIIEPEEVKAEEFKLDFIEEPAPEITAQVPVETVSFETAEAFAVEAKREPETFEPAAAPAVTPAFEQTVAKAEELIAEKTSEALESRVELPKEEVRAIVEKAAREIIQEVAWEVVPQIAEEMIRAEINRIRELLLKSR